MTDILSNKFILALEPARDQLYTLALAREQTPAKAEAALQKSVRTLFPDFIKNPSLDIPAAIEVALTPPASPLTPNPSPLAPQHMPADVWARLAAAVQLTAATSVPTTPGTHALNPDSVLLSPDPLLAPRKPAPFDDDDIPAPSRFLFASTIALLIGITLTIYILTRPAAPRRPLTQPATQPMTLTR
ncbi:MAG TPA: hypothetical protein VM008_09845 [Phycisphaerae bacterium]|nr:hypothetical protein [Phycisphaerae bacterium]